MLYNGGHLLITVKSSLFVLPNILNMSMQDVKKGIDSSSHLKAYCFSSKETQQKA